MFHKQNARQPLAVILLALLLALTSAFSCIGLSGWISFQRQLAALEANYTTVAYNIDNNMWTTIYDPPVEEYMDDGSILFEDGTIRSSPQRLERLADSAPGFLRRDTNVLTAAHTPGLKGMSSGAADPLTYMKAYDEGRYAQSVVAMRCLSVEDNPNSESSDFIWFEWIDPVCRMAAYDLPEHSRVIRFSYPGNSLFTDENGTIRIPFEPGKTYLLRGTFIDFETQFWYISEEEGWGWYRYTQDYLRELKPDVDPTLNPTQHLSDTPWQILDISLPQQWEGSNLTPQDTLGRPYPLVPNFYLDSVRWDDSSPWKCRLVLPEGSWPLYAEYEGDWRDFLETEEGRVWKEEIIPCYERSHDSAAVLLTDNIQSLSQFCQEESALLEGRFITREEYDSGAAVCMVGADYALYNDLQVGDTITLDLYKPAYFSTFGQVWQGPNGAVVNYTCCMPLVDENRLDVVRDYTIVGLYTVPARPLDPDGHGFRGDTVLAPKASAPEVVNAAEEDKVTPLLNTLVLKNGSIEEFEAYMAENGAAKRFRYHDYGYTEIRSSLESMGEGALRLAVLGGAAFLIGAAVFLLASFARMSPSARSLRLLGANSRRVTQDMLCALVPLTAAGVLMGGVLGGLLYGQVCQLVLSQVLAPDWVGLAVCALLQLAVLGAAEAVWAALTARRSLMRRK